MSYTEWAKIADEKVDPGQLVAATSAIEDVWEKLALVLKPQMFDKGSIRVIKREDDSEFTRANTMLQKWANNVDKLATRRQLILAMCAVKESAKARKEAW